MAFAPEDKLSDDVEDELTTVSGRALCGQKDDAHLHTPVAMVSSSVSMPTGPVTKNTGLRFDRVCIRLGRRLRWSTQLCLQLRPRFCLPMTLMHAEADFLEFGLLSLHGI